MMRDKEAAFVADETASDAQQYVVTDKGRHTAIVVRTGRSLTHFVVMRAGRLMVKSQPHAAFAAEWQRLEYSLSKAAAHFREHALRTGASDQVVKALTELSAADPGVTSGTSAEAITA